MGTVATSWPAPEVKPVHFREAIDFVAQKIAMPSRAWTDVWQDMHARAFVVAGATRDQLVADFHAAVTRALAEGRSAEQFRADFDSIVAKHGWSHRGSPGWRSRVIWQTNLRTAHSAGRWAQAQRLKARRPYLRYVATLDSRTRPEHRQLHGTILPVDHPFWQTYMPPNGWHCRCSTMSVSERDLERRGWAVTTDPPELPLVDRVLRTPEGDVVIQVPRGVDPGFAYNPGEGAIGRGAQQMAAAGHGGWAPLEAPGIALRRAALPDVPLDAPRATIGPRLGGDATPDALRAALREALGGNEAVLADSAGGVVTVGQGIVDHILAQARPDTSRAPFWRFIPELIERPAEIWMGFARGPTGRVQLRRRYIKGVDVGKGSVLYLIGDEAGGLWQGLTFFQRGDLRQIDRLRTGVLVHARA